MAPAAPEAPAPGAISAATAAILAAPTNLVAKANSATAITLTWSDKSSTETGFEVWRSTTGPTGTFSKRTTTGANVKSWKDTGLTTVTQYCYQVRAVGDTGVTPSDFTSAACAITLLKTPADFVATLAASSAILLTWSDRLTAESGFEVWRSTTGSSGTYTRLVAVPANTTYAQDAGLDGGARYCYKVRALGSTTAPTSLFSGVFCATTPSTFMVRVVLFGDSNTDRCEEIQPPNRISSYVSMKPRLKPSDPPLLCSMAGKVDSAWRAASTTAFRVVNHAIASTTTGGGGFGGPDRTSQGAPNARTQVNGVTRFEGEVLGTAYPWAGGEPVNSYFPGPVLRINAYAPGARDFAYVSMGTNDDAGTRKLTAAQTGANLRWMAEQWIAAGGAPDHFILTTLAPRNDANSPTSIPDRNTLIRALAADLGLHLVELAGFVSDDNGATWRSPLLNIGDGVHYTQAVRSWLGGQIADWMASATP
jgi:lysophospholipase L1-like esterase